MVSIVVALYQTLTVRSLAGLSALPMFGSRAACASARAKARLRGFANARAGTSSEGAGNAAVPMYVPPSLLPEVSSAAVPLASSKAQRRTRPPGGVPDPHTPSTQGKPVSQSAWVAQVVPHVVDKHR